MQDQFIHFGASHSRGTMACLVQWTNVWNLRLHCFMLSCTDLDCQNHSEWLKILRLHCFTNVDLTSFVINHGSIMAQVESPILLTVNLVVPVGNLDTALPRLPPHIPYTCMSQQPQWLSHWSNWCLQSCHHHHHPSSWYLHQRGNPHLLSFLHHHLLLWPHPQLRFPSTSTTANAHSTSTSHVHCQATGPCHM